MTQFTLFQTLKQDQIDRVCDSVIKSCNRVLYHARDYGFQLMELPDPDARKMYNLIHRGILPILEELESDPNIDPENGIKLANVKEYIRHLRNVVKAMDDNDEAAFNRAIDALNGEKLIS